jgi:hypothetical protein
MTIRTTTYDSATGGVAVTAGTPLASESKAIYVGTSGDLVAKLSGGETLTFANLPVGLYPLSISLVVASGTTADDIVALY